MQIVTLASEIRDLIPMVSIVGGLAFAFLMIALGAYKSISRERAREESRREIAAYVAEGSITAEDGAKLMEAGMPAWERPKRT